MGEGPGIEFAEQPMKKTHEEQSINAQSSETVHEETYTESNMIVDRKLAELNISTVTINGEELDKTIDSMVGKIDGAWTCNVCGKIDKRKQNLQSHIESLHIEGVTHPCNICGNKFKSRHGLQVHMSGKHRNKPY